MHRKTITELAEALHQKECSCLELTRYFLDRINRYNPALNAFITPKKKH